MPHIESSDGCAFFPLHLDSATLGRSYSSSHSTIIIRGGYSLGCTASLGN